MRFLIFLILLITIQSQAKVLESQAAPFFSSGRHSFVSHEILGTSCFSFRSLRSELACSAALIDEPVNEEDPDSIFAGNLLVGNDYNTIYRNRELIAGDDKVKLAESLLTEPKPVRFEGSSTFWWRGVNTAVSFQPVRWTYYSSVTNSAYPQIAIHAMQERSVQLQWGGRLDEKLRFGFDVLGIERSFIHEEFVLFEALPEMDQHLLLKKQNLLLVEPSVAYLLETNEDSWRPMLTGQISQIGYADKKYDEAPLKPVLDTGLSVNPPLAYGEWELGLNYRWTSPVAEERTVRVGTSYQLGLAKFLAGYDPRSWGMGVEATYSNVMAGLAYKRSSLKSLNGETVYDDGASLEFRITL